MICKVLVLPMIVSILFHQRKSTCHKKAWPIVKMLLVLSHRQATVKRSFWINKELIVENQHIESLVVKHVANVDISRSMIVFVRGPMAQY